jgi:hypothetical protein
MTNTDAQAKKLILNAPAAPVPQETVEKVLNILKEKYAVFKDCKPLCGSVKQAVLMENPDISMKILQAVMKSHVMSPAYTQKFTEETHRYNLAGEAVREISEEDRKQKMNQKQHKPHKVNLDEVKPLLEKLKEKYPVFKKAKPLCETIAQEIQAENPELSEKQIEDILWWHQRSPKYAQKTVSKNHYYNLQEEKISEVTAEDKTKAQEALTRIAEKLKAKQEKEAASSVSSVVV